MTSLRELARGGEATIDNVRMRCRTHNQHTAERTFGEGFMNEKRRAAKEARAAAKTRAAAQAKAAAQEVILCLRALGARADEARRAAALCEAIPDAPLEDRVKLALRSFAPPSARRSVHLASSPG